MVKALADEKQFFGLELIQVFNISLAKYDRPIVFTRIITAWLVSPFAI